MSNGEKLDQNKATIATWLPDFKLGDRVMVTSKCGSIEVIVTDRMPRPKGGKVVMDATAIVADTLFCKGFGATWGSEIVTIEKVIDQ